MLTCCGHVSGSVLVCKRPPAPLLHSLASTSCCGLHGCDPHKLFARHFWDCDRPEQGASGSSKQGPWQEGVLWPTAVLGPQQRLASSHTLGSWQKPSRTIPLED